AASWRYYGRAPHQLSWAESATLAILPNDPASIFPGKNHHLFLKKRNKLLQKIHERGFIDEDELFLAMEEKLPNAIKQLPKQAYHLLQRSITEGNSGVNIQTTLDARLQYEANKKVNEYSKKMAFNQIHNAAAIILEIQSGNTLAYVGNTNNKGNHGQYVDIITSKRSPGSLLKPFLYAAALDEGLIMPKQLLPDIPIFYKGFSPKNFDKEYRGAVPADDALISSLNVPFVHLLIEYGYEKFHQKLLQMGFQSFDKSAGHYGLSLILGGAETSLWELTEVYSGMARALNNFTDRPYRLGYSEADYHSNHYLKKETNNEVADYKSDGHIRAPSIRYALEAMKKLKRPIEEAGWNFFTSSKAISWKTGTSFGFRDGWAIGLNNEHLVGVWIGNADGEGRPGLTGVRAAAPLLFELFDLLKENPEATAPFGMTNKLCEQSGMLATSICNNTYEMQLPEYLLENSTCTLHQIVHLNKEGTHQVNSSCYEVSHIRNDSWFVLPPVQAWYYKKYHPKYKPLPPYLAGCRQSNTEILFDLIYPSQFTKVQIPLEQGGLRGKAIFEAAHQNSDAVVYWHLDQQYLGYTQGSHQKGIQADKGFHVITLIDDSGNERSQKFEVID
ncbi:MAG: penicillin-binding transpeptidase domain-containing protein, partial [Cyclobacteriaceae bacterium]|nr:penicillin-binding transpeptidase domain-containing protein [Cyclobacteriaceae bacterium]